MIDPAPIRDRFTALSPHLNERERRLLAATEAAALGYGGIAGVSAATGIVVRLQASGLPARRLELEITETVLLQNTVAVMTVLRSLHDRGVRIAIDDFGTGYSSLSYLGSFPFDKIKIDRSFINGCHAVPAGVEGTALLTPSAAADSAATIVRAIIGLGQNLGISTIAEGVETEAQFARLRHQECSEVQGYFLSEPRPAADLAALMQRLDATLPAIGVTGHLHAASSELSSHSTPPCRHIQDRDAQALQRTIHMSMC